MTIQVTEAELWTWNALNNNIANAQAELQRIVTARDDYLHKLEKQYNAKFDIKSGKFIPLDGAKEKSKAKEKINEMAS